MSLIVRILVSTRLHKPRGNESMFEYKFECPENIMNVLDALQLAWFDMRGPENPFSNTGAIYDGIAFRAHAYLWSEENNQEFNFAWRDIRISWYKYLGRSTFINRVMLDDEVSEMLNECMQEIHEDSTDSK